jgi:hypothetical protein
MSPTTVRTDQNQLGKEGEGATSIFESQTLGKLGNFLSLSENARSRASAAAERKKQQSSQKTDRLGRRSSILGSLDKFLTEESEATECTGSLTHQSSISSGLSSLESSAIARNAALRWGGHATSTANCERLNPSNRVVDSTNRPGRRGSVTKYSLETFATSSLSSSEDDEFFVFKQMASDTIVPQQTFRLSKKTKRVAALKQTMKSMSLDERTRSASTATPRSIDTDPQSRQGSKSRCARSTYDAVNDRHTAGLHTLDAIDVKLVPSWSYNHKNKNDYDALVDKRSIPTRVCVRSQTPYRHSDTSTESPTSLANLTNEGEYDKAGRSGDVDNLESHDCRLRSRNPEKSKDCHPVVSQRRLQRRGSITKYSLHKGPASLDNRNADFQTTNFGYDDQRSIHSEQLPPRPRRMSTIPLQPRSSMPTQNIGGREMCSLGVILASLPSDTSDAVNRYGLQGDQQSLASHHSETCSTGSRRRYQRRGSVTKYSLHKALGSLDCAQAEMSIGGASQRLPVENRSIQSDQIATLSLGRNNTVSCSRKPCAPGSNSCEEGRRNSGSSLSKHDAMGRPTHQRRGSVTRYNLNN